MLDDTSSEILIPKTWFDNRNVLRDPLTRREAFLWICLKCVDKPTTVDGILLGRGQITGTIRFLGHQWGWCRSRVKRFLDQLVDDGRVLKATRNNQTVLTVLKYEDYAK